jgi:penicillin-binding protein 1A
VLLWLSLPFAAVAIGAGMGFLYAFAQVPVPVQSKGSETIFIYDSQKHEIGRLVPEDNREWVPLKDIPPVMREAVLSAEDHNFYDHGAISYRALGRAFVANLRGGGVSQGGSTLSQQYIKVTYNERDKSYLRKAKEAMLAVKLEQKYSKDQILEFYLNTIYFGRGASGVKAASKAYFPNTKLKDLKPQQAALLAGIIRNPEFYARKENWGEAQARRDRVLKIMGDEGYLTAAEVAKAQAAPHGIDPKWQGVKAGAINSDAPHFVEKVRLFLMEQLGPDALARGGFKVYTTLDSDMQLAAKNAVTQTLDEPKTDPKAALVAIDSRTGAVKAMYGGRNFKKSQFNYAMDARRQIGSTVKPFLLAEWLEQGYSVDSNLPGRKCFLEEGKLCNYGGADYGELVPVREAIRKSMNVPFVEMLEKLGREEVIARLKQAGISSKIIVDKDKGDGEDRGDREAYLPPELSLALGAAESSTLQLTSAFGTFANDGVHVEPYLVSKVITLDNKTVWKHEKQSTEVMSPNTAHTVSALLSDVIQSGTGTRANIGIPAAGKTGTTDENHDARFAGYVPNGLVASVWLGYDNNRPMLRIHDFPTVDGGTLPAVVWRKFMLAALAGQTPEAFGTFQPEGEVVNPTTTVPTTTLPPTTTGDGDGFPFPGPGRRGGGGGGGGGGGPDPTFPFPTVTEPQPGTNDGVSDGALTP